MLLLAYPGSVMRDVLFTQHSGIAEMHREQSRSAVVTDMTLRACQGGARAGVTHGAAGGSRRPLLVGLVPAGKSCLCS